MVSKEQIGRKCPYCGAMITYDEYFCRACHRKFTDPGDLDAPSRYQPDTYVVGLPKIWISAAFSVLGVGLGQFYNGDMLKGVAFFLGFLLISFGYFITPYHKELILCIWALATIDALWSARKIGRCERPYDGASVLLYAELCLLGLVALLHTITGEPDLLYLAKLFPAIGIWVG